MKKLFKLSIILLSLTFVVSCTTDDLDPVLTQDKDLASGIKNVADLKSVLNSAYDRLSISGYYGRDVLIWGDIWSDNAYANGNSGRSFWNNMEYLPESGPSWAGIYNVAAICNIVIGADHANLEGNQAEITHVVGQAHALRALVHYDALRHFGQHFVNGGGPSSLGVPYVKTYKVPENLAPPRDTVAQNYADLQADLVTAIGSMSPAFETGGDKTSYMTQAGAYAIWARVALYGGAVVPSLYSAAGDAAKWVIDNSGAAPVTASSYVSHWSTDNASNSLFELAFSSTDTRGINGMMYILRGQAYGDVRILTSATNDVTTAPDLYDVYDANDIRFSAAMIGPERGFPTMLGKYPTNGGYDNVGIIRIEEMHLIYAEAMLRAGDAATAKTYLNNIPAIRGLGADYYASATLANIMLERRKEFAFEGLRYDDFQRMGMDLPLVDVIKQRNDDKTGTPPAFGSHRRALPITMGEMNANPNMVQNYGY